MTTHTNPPLWTGAFVRICLVNLFIFVNVHALLPTFPFYVASQGGGAVAIGIATALFSLASIAARPFVGHVADARGRRPLLVAGTLGLVLLSAGYAVAGALTLALVMRAAHGACHAAASNASNTWVTDLLPRRRMGEGLGMFGLSMALSTAVAPALGLWVMQAAGFGPLFSLAAGAALLALLLGLSIPSGDFVPKRQPLQWRNLMERMAVPAAVSQFFFMMAFGVVEVYIALFAEAHKLPGAGLYFIAVALATVAARVLLGRTLDRRGEALPVLLGNGAMVLSMLLPVLGHSMVCYLLSALLAGFAFGAVQPSLQTMAMRAVEPARRGAANSTFLISFDLGIALGAFAAGLLVQRWGYGCMFVLMSAAAVLSALYYAVVGRHHASAFRSAAAAAESAPSGEALPRVITISREYGSDGHRLGAELARELGVRLYDRQLLELVARESGLRPEEVSDNEESALGLLRSEDAEQADLFRLQSALIRRVAAAEPCVIVGRLANFVLRGRPNCLSVFIYADEPTRARRIAEREGISESEALTALHAADRRRRDYCLHYTGCDWGDRRYYHALIDSGRTDALGVLRALAQQQG